MMELKPYKVTFIVCQTVVASSKQQALDILVERIKDGRGYPTISIERIVNENV